MSRVVALAALAVLHLSALAQAQSARNVLVVVNAASPDSVRIGEHYAGKRHIPGDQVLRLSGLPADPPDGIDRPLFERAIGTPIAGWLTKNQAQDRILFIVLTKGIPLRINAGTEPESAASVDSELAVLYARMTGVAVPVGGPLANPYFLGDRPIAEARPFSRETSALYLVTRLDGFTVDDVIRVIDRGVEPSRVGRFVLDGRLSMNPQGNNWLRIAAERLKAGGLSGDRVMLDESAAVITGQADVLGYYSWGSNDFAIRRRTFDLQFRPGAIGAMFVSTDARTFREPPPDWKVLNDWTDKKTWFAGSPQSLTGDLIRAGITGAAGHVSEPRLGYTIRPDILFPAYVAGFSLAESFYLAMPSVSWMTVVVGDPLCAPFAEAPRSVPDPPIDTATELPQLFSQRRIAALASTGAPKAALEALLRADSRSTRGDKAGARADFERAAELAPAYLPAQYAFALTLEAAGEYDAAIARYRAILNLAPDEWLALNNLAYGLAVRKRAPSDAAPLAERARSLAPRSGVVADTVGWIAHLLGDNEKALAVLKEAVTLSPGVADIWLHLARVSLEQADVEAARTQLEHAVALDPSLSTDPLYREILDHLKQARP